MSLSINKLYRFDEFVLDPARRTFARNSKSVSISPKAFDVLAYLVSNPGRVVTKEELLKAVWPDSFVEEGNLAQHISWLRKALGDASNDIVTVPGRGYQFTAQVRTESPADLLSETQAGDMLVHGARERTHLVIEEVALVPLTERRTRALTRVWPYYALVIVGVIVAAVWAGWRWWWRPAARADFYKIVVADFANTTGDGTFDHTLKRALEIDLEQSPFLDVMSEREAVSTLQLMGQKKDAAITANVATELCVRSNRQLLLTGSIASVGTNYLLTLEATDCNSGKKLAGAKKQAATKEDVLAAIDAVADRIRKGLGESARSLESFQVPILQATTPSLDALKAYSLGQYLIAQGKNETESLPFFQKAVELDPQFAMAYGAMAIDYYNLNEYNLAAQYSKKAFELSGRVSEREKLVLRAHYYGGSQKDLVQGIRAYQLWASTYPHEWVPWVDIANDWTQLGHYEEAIPAGVRALELEPNREINYSVLARAYMRANRFADAKAIGERAVRRGKDSEGLHGTLFFIAFAEHDQNALARETKYYEAHADLQSFDDRAFAVATLGKYREAQDLYRRSWEAALQANLPETADDILLERAMMEFDLGLPAASRTTLSHLNKSGPDSPDLAILRAKLGDAYAEHFLADHANETHDTLMAYVYIPLVRATLALGRKKPLDAIAALEPATPYELRDYAVPTQRGQAYLQAHQPEKAAVEYKKVLANPGVAAGSYLFPLAHLGLARAYALQNHKTESREEYEKFFALWKDSDADVPVLKQARLEYARLQ